MHLMRSIDNNKVDDGKYAFVLLLLNNNLPCATRSR